MRGLSKQVISKRCSWGKIENSWLKPTTSSRD